MKKLNNYRAVLFDMDGVIVDSMGHHAESWLKIFKDFFNLELSHKDIFLREGMSGIASMIDILRENNMPEPDEEKLLSLREEKLKYFKSSKVQMFPETEKILNFLHSKGIKLGLVTGSVRRSVNHLLGDSVINHFNTIVTVDDITRGKPHPESYMHALHAIKQQSTTVLAVENAPMGISSAKGAELDCIAITTTLDSTYLSEADRIFNSHEELYEYFKGIF